MEAPPPTLVERLAELRIATPRDWRQAERICRRLAADLPVFEELWIDALLRMRRLTAFQAAALRDGHGDRLWVDDFVLVDRLGGHSSEIETFRALQRAGGAAVAIKVLPSSAWNLPSLAEQARALCDMGSRLPAVGLIAPNRAIEHGDRVLLISRFASGRDARSVLIRRGALPAKAVMDVARQLVELLDVAHRHGLVHGDVRLENVRLTERNEVSLVDCGVRSLVSPVLSIQGERRVEQFQGIAPERIGTAAPATMQSDIYSLGCLLWHLLAGRPPFPHSDRLAVLTAHRLKPVPCIRDFAVDLPREVVDALAEMTSSDPEQRPTDLSELAKRFGKGSTKRSLTRGRKESGRRNDAIPWVAAAALIVALGGTAVSFADRGSLASLFDSRVASHEPVASGQVASQATSRDGASSPSARPIPAPDVRGVITFEHPGPYAATEIVHQGRLMLRGPRERMATIFVHDQPLHLLAEEVILENIEIVFLGHPGITAPAALALIESQNLSLRSCRVATEKAATTATKTASPRSGLPAAIAWRRTDASDATGGQIAASHCVFRDVSTGLTCSSAPRRVRIENSLSVSTGSLLVMRSGGPFPVEIDLDRVTLRDVGSAFGIGEQAEDLAVTVAASDSILSLASDSLLGGPLPQGSSVRWRGSGVVTTRDISLTTGATDLSGTVEGIMTGDVRFAGPESGGDAASAARVRGVPQRAGRPPGVDASQLPRGFRTEPN